MKKKNKDVEQDLPKSIPLSKIVKEEYRTYQIYSLMDRAIPSLDDGLKPGQRRILFTLWKNQSKGLIKVSSATGLVLTLHPHGPASIESSLVNLAQDFTFSNNYPLLDKKGYFGERMETSPAAGRYIECKLGKVADLLLFDDLNQVEMIPNYDEKVMEPSTLLPKLPLMLLNGAEGIGTGFSSVIPSFHHRDIVNSMIYMIQKGKAKKLKPHFHHYGAKYTLDAKGKLIFNMVFEEQDGKIYITELPRNYDSTRTYRFLGKFIDDGFLKDFIDSSVDNEIRIELVFKRSQQPSLEQVREVMKCATTLVPNYTLISDRGVKIFTRPEEIIEIFTLGRLDVIKRRFELLCEDYEQRIKKNNEIIRFIKQKHYVVATKSSNRKSFVEYLTGKKFVFADYLADMPIYRMVKDEVSKRKLLVKEETTKLKRFTKIAKSKMLIKKELILELNEVKDRLDDLLKQKDKEKAKILAELVKQEKKTAKKVTKKRVRKK